MTIRDAVLSDSADIARLTSLLGYAADAETISCRLARIPSCREHLVIVAVLNEEIVGWLQAHASVVLESGSASCNGQNFAAIQAEIDKTVSSPELKSVSNSLLILHTSFELTDEPSLPNEPALFGRNLFALAGMVITLLLGLVLFSIDFPSKSGTESAH